MAKERVEIKDQVNVTDFEAVKISVASPDDILTWSHGEVLKPETINYRTQKPERDGLFCERIFGPTKDWECYCGKYKKIRYKGVVCDKCGVEVTRSSVRRIRLGHIDLSVPVAHIWYTRGTASVIASVLSLSVSDLEKVVYFASFIVMDIDKEIQAESLASLEEEYQDYLTKIKKSDPTKSEASKELEKQKIDAAYKQAKSDLTSLKAGTIISEERYNDLTIKYGQVVSVNIGAEAILDLLKRVNIDEEIIKIKGLLEKDSGTNKRKYLKSLRILNNLNNAGLKPEWLILTRLPVIPPDLRPMVQLDGGRFAASDLNDLYRRVLNRNNRLKRLISQGAPEVICRNEKRMLQEAVDALIDNSARKGKVASSAGGKRKLRSLSDMIRGKQGRFRQNLLGKRVDYSGRSVIVVGPNLKLHQCGIPKVMALELFKPFVIGRLIKDGYVHNVKNATRLIDQGESFVWDILEEITRDHHVMLNRAPTLHRLGIQAFQPVLIEGKAIQIHPLVCSAFNADFDGDQMAVHVPLSEQAEIEAGEIMLSSKNLLKPASGDPIVTPKLDIILGLYYISTINPDAKDSKKVFSNSNQAVSAYDAGKLDLRSMIKVRIGDEIIETTAGRIILNENLPEGHAFENANFDEKKIRSVISNVYHTYGKEETAKLVDNFKDLGFKYASKSGITFAVEDIIVTPKKTEIIKVAQDKLDKIDSQFMAGFLTEDEKYAKTVELWMDASSEVEKAMVSAFTENNDLFIFMKSGARGNVSQLNQIAGMKGLVADPTGNIIELPIISNFKEGLSVFEYFVSTHGSRKGRADTALRTSEAGYLTRRLVDVSQDTVITSHDCGTDRFRTMNRAFFENEGVTWDFHIKGRVLFEEAAGIKAETMLTDKEIAKLNEENVPSIKIRSLLGCIAEKGVCQNCYGQDPATGQLVSTGATVGIVAAQAIGEPGTQLTMRTFHTGGAAGEDITSGLPRVEELFEARVPKSPAIISEIEGEVTINKEKTGTSIIVMGVADKAESHVLPAEYKWIVKNGAKVKSKEILAEAIDQKPVRANFAGEIKIDGDKGIISGRGKVMKEYDIQAASLLKVKNGSQVKMGDMLTEGHLELSSAIKLCGIEATQNYIINDVQKIYESQGQHINDKHLEVIVRQMCSKVRIIASDNELDFLPGQIIDSAELGRENIARKKSGKKQIEVEPIIMGMSRVALKTKSFLSAASFMETTSVLIDAAISGKTDHLVGLKENVIIGKLIPAGTGLRTPKE